MPRTTPRAAVALGAVGSALVAAGGFGAGSVPASLAGSWLHGTSTGRVVATVVSATGVVALLVAWWLLRGAASRVVLTAAATWTAPLLVAVPLFSRDVFAYAGQAHLVDVGVDPYTHGPADAPGPLAAEVDDVWAHARSPYGPVFLRVASWLVPGQHVLASVFLLRMLCVAGLALLAWSLLRVAADAGTALWLAVANPLVLLHGIGGAHNDLLMAGLLAAGLAIARASPSQRRTLVAAAALITLAALIKAPAAAGLAFLPFVVAGGRARAALVVAVTSAVTAIVLTAATGLGWGWLHTLGAGNARRSLMSVSTGAGVLASTLAGDGAVHVAQVVGVGVAGVVGLWLLLRRAPVDPTSALGLALLTVAVLGPVVQPWYLLWSLPVLAVVAGPRLATGIAAACAVLCLLILPSGRHVIRPPLYGVPPLLALAAGYAASRDPHGAAAP
ncbi:MAG: alpha,6-mannosyltransferase [Actinomycetota bacterium]|nr:alpha,6-mannosyltransferase [Actinomycetota bacterium]